MIVECYDEKGAEVYEMIIKHIMQEIQISRSINDIRVYADPREPVFIIAIKVEKTSKPVKIEDFAEYKFDEEEDKIVIRIKDETYLPQLLEKLWELEGREKIQQPSRFDVIINHPSNKIEGMIVDDPAENLKRKIYDAIFRILPEGFRVIRDLSQGNIIAMTTSDEILKDEWIQKGRELVNELKD
ncbi:MAG: methanogenesis marker 17 protein [Methanobacteriaceae archaeon]|nr:methanogenesis marker 17 protein [Methanobacteriaceae archaeon]